MNDGNGFFVPHTNYGTYFMLYWDWILDCFLYPVNHSIFIQNKSFLMCYENWTWDRRAQRCGRMVSFSQKTPGIWVEETSKTVGRIQCNIFMETQNTDAGKIHFIVYIANWLLFILQSLVKICCTLNYIKLY